jgi:hypothetical protein
MKNYAFLSSLFFASLTTNAQSIGGGTINGNFESTFQYLKTDSSILAFQPESKALVNGFMNVFYTNQNFRAGLRAETYLPKINGYPNGFDGTGIGMRYIGWGNEFIDLTLGNFYEQFGVGSLFRSYEDRNLGYDNAMDGMRIILKPIKGVTLKGVYGRQRIGFVDGKTVNATGIVRGFDGTIHLNNYFSFLDSNNLDFKLGGSFVSKFEDDNNELYELPQNVGSYGGHLEARWKKWMFYSEVSFKENDPSSDNKFNYGNGHSGLFTLAYSQKGMSLNLQAKSVDNMSFRSKREGSLQEVLINYLPALNRTHTYNLVATLYPYATRPLGEVAYQGEFIYVVKKGTKLGGKYGLPITLNYSSAHLPILDSLPASASDSSRVFYKTKWFDASNTLLWQDFNVLISKKFSKRFGINASYYNIAMNNDYNEVTLKETGVIRSNIAVLEFDYKISKTHNLRTELQGLFTKQDRGDWATLVAEYTISPSWFFGIIDQYNFGNPDKKERQHFIVGSVGYSKDATRLVASFGRQRAGIFCVGGVCRFVPASNGLTISVSHTF